MTTVTVAGYDVASVRSRYPALSDGWAYLDGAAGTQVPRAVIEAESAAYAAGIGNHGGTFAASRRSDALTAAARAAVADLVGAPSSAGVVLGPSTTALVYRFAEALAKAWRPNDEIVLTRLDHDANVRPWVQAAGRAQVRVRWADPVLPSLDLPTEVVAELLGPLTRLVAVTGASNVVGTRPDIRAIADAAHAAGALLFVDGVHATPHTAVDVVALGADFWATSAYKWSGPHVAAVAAAPSCSTVCTRASWTRWRTSRPTGSSVVPHPSLSTPASQPRSTTSLASWPPSTRLPLAGSGSSPR